MKVALGKGLGALIPGKTEGVLELEIDKIIPSEYQPRRIFKDDTLKELAASIREMGILQPVIVRMADDGSFRLIAGERRLRAARIAGLEKIPALVKDAARAEALELALVENIQREDLNPIETADAFNRLMRDFNLTQDDISKKVGKERATVANYLRILRLPSEVKNWITEGSLSMGHAKALLQLDGARAQTEAAKKIIKKGLSVREAEALSKRLERPVKTVRHRDPQIASLEEKLIQHLGTKVRLIHKGKKGGKIEIEYYSLDELDRLLGVLLG